MDKLMSDFGKPFSSESADSPMQDLISDAKTMTDFAKLALQSLIQISKYRFK
jgi:hypothetical protein